MNCNSGGGVAHSLLVLPRDCIRLQFSKVNDLDKGHWHGFNTRKNPFNNILCAFKRCSDRN